MWVIIMLDYYKIGQRIRKFRKAQSLSQEQLAEIVDISATHMSHIETGNTKLSLAVLVDIASALNVSCDELLFDEPQNQRKDALTHIQYIFDTCTPQQAKMISEIIKAIKQAVDKYS